MSTVYCRRIDCNYCNINICRNIEVALVPHFDPYLGDFLKCAMYSKKKEVKEK